MKSYDTYETKRFSTRHNQNNLLLNLKSDHYYIINCQEGRIYKHSHSITSKFRAEKCHNYKQSKESSKMHRIVRELIHLNVD